MAGTIINIVVVLLTAAFAIASIITLFAVASHFFNAVVEAFQQGFFHGIGMLIMVLGGLAIIVYGIHIILPYAESLYRQAIG